MPIEIKEFKKALSKIILKKAERLVVRELDEVKPNHFESFVDEDKETYDVALTIKEGILHKSNCDCVDGNKTICVHKTAVILSIADKKKIATKTIKGKANALQLLLESAEEDKLKKWVYDLLQNNKDLEIAFTHHFTEKPTSYTKDDVLKSTQTAYKAIVKNKKNIEQSELKKLLQLWQNVHEPIIQSYLKDISDENNFEHLITITEQCRVYNYQLNINTVKIHNYAVSLLVKVIEPLNNYANEDGWKKIVQLFLNALTNNNKDLSDYFFIFIIKLLEICKADRKIYLIDEFLNTYKNITPRHLYDGEHSAKKLLDIVEAAGLFNKYIDVFKPITFDNTFNIKLIKALIDNGNYEQAEKFSKAQIAGNYREEYNLHYYIFLKSIYILTKQPARVVDICKALLPLTFNFEDYLTVIKSFDNEAIQKEFRNKIYTKARSNGRNGYVPADDLCFKILNLENKPTKMIEIIDSYTPFNRIVEYFNIMYAANKDALIKQIFLKSDPWNLRGTAVEDDDETFIQLYNLIKNSYGELYINLAIKNIKVRNYYNKNKFMAYVEKNYM